MLGTVVAVAGFRKKDELVRLFFLFRLIFNCTNSVDNVMVVNVTFLDVDLKNSGVASLVNQ